MLSTSWANGNTVDGAAMNTVAAAVNSLTGFSYQNSNYPLTAADRFITADASSGAITLTLPLAASCPGKQYVVKKVDTSTNIVTLTTTSSQTIDGSASQLLVFPNQRISVISDGSNWWVVDSNYSGTQLGYASVTASSVTVNSSNADLALASNTITGLSLTTVGTGRPVQVQFLGQAYNTVANAFNVAQLLINSSAVGGVGAACSVPVNTGQYASLSFQGNVVLTAGTSYTFTVGMWCKASTEAVFYADSTTPMPMTLTIVGQ